MPWRRHAYLASLSHLEDLQPGKLLEIGCGSGAFLRSAKAAGWKVVGLDFDERAVQGCVASGLDVRAGDVLTEQFDAGSFDAVVMNNVMEHLHQPVETVSKVHSLLKKGGRLVSVTPNPRSLGHRIHGGAWRGLEPPRHLNLFSPPALKKMAVSVGFSSAQAFSARSAQLDGWNSSPPEPSSTSSGIPATLGAITGTPMAIASISTTGRPSMKLGKTNRSACAMA
jgi:SAM-dependent methyltransferase